MGELIQTPGADQCARDGNAGVDLLGRIGDYARLDQIDETVAGMRAAMAEASRVVLAGFELRTDFKIVRWPDRYMDPRGAVMWARVWELLDRTDQLRRTA